MTYKMGASVTKSISISRLHNEGIGFQEIAYIMGAPVAKSISISRLHNEGIIMGAAAEKKRI